ncbi:uncharacterized protein LOC122036090 [Zingiber officinale]|uniref:uncharacterized protein LOC122036090 n=1 Tax=Zingiber officinale TaxID=94328 RepID=UPI001C4BB70D|nr:uncharacterized protein LOC122036090 [Zingiber officinale]
MITASYLIGDGSLPLKSSSTATIPLSPLFRIGSTVAGPREQEIKNAVTISQPSRFTRPSSLVPRPGRGATSPSASASASASVAEPVFCATEEDFADRLDFIYKIRPHPEPFSICHIYKIDQKRLRKLVFNHYMEPSQCQLQLPAWYSKHPFLAQLVILPTPSMLE